MLLWFFVWNSLAQKGLHTTRWLVLSAICCLDIMAYIRNRKSCIPKCSQSLLTRAFIDVCAEKGIFAIKERIEFLNKWVLCIILYIKMICQNYKSSLEKWKYGSKNLKNGKNCAMWIKKVENQRISGETFWLHFMHESSIILFVRQQWL